MSETSTPPPGWYDHPTKAGARRYWDGQQWTDHVATQPPVERRGAPGFGVITGAIVAGGTALALMVWIVFTFVRADNELDCSVERMDAAAEGRPISPDCD